jgi:hypothetical protein
MTPEKTQSVPYYNVAQMRVDLWNELKAASAGLADARTDGVGKRNREQVDHILVKLGGIEQYFAFPGVPRMQTMLRTLERGEYTSLARQASENAQLLVSDAYRGDLDVYAEDEEEDRVVRVRFGRGAKSGLDRWWDVRHVAPVGNSRGGVRGLRAELERGASPRPEAAILGTNPRS